MCTDPEVHTVERTKALAVHKRAQVKRLAAQGLLQDRHRQTAVGLAAVHRQVDPGRGDDRTHFNLKRGLTTGVRCSGKTPHAFPDSPPPHCWRTFSHRSLCLFTLSLRKLSIDVQIDLIRSRVQAAKFPITRLPVFYKPDIRKTDMPSNY